jgi:hypothetical protein
MHTYIDKYIHIYRWRNVSHRVISRRQQHHTRKHAHALQKFIHTYTHTYIHTGGAMSLTELSLESNNIDSLPPSIGNMRISKLRLDENPLQRPPVEVAIRGPGPTFEFLQRLQYSIETWDLDLSNFALKQVWVGACV